MPVSIFQDIRMILGYGTVKNAVYNKRSANFISRGHCTFAPISSNLYPVDFASFAASASAYISAPALDNDVTGCLLERQCIGMPFSMMITPVWLLVPFGAFLSPAWSESQYMSQTFACPFGSPRMIADSFMLIVVARYAITFLAAVIAPEALPRSAPPPPQ